MMQQKDGFGLHPEPLLGLFLASLATCSQCSHLALEAEPISNTAYHRHGRRKMIASIAFDHI